MGFLTAAVAADLACYVDADGLLFRSVADVSDAVGATPNNVREALRQLSEAGLLEVPEGVTKRSTTKSKGRAATTYRLLMVDISHPCRGEKSQVIFHPHGGENEEAISTPTRVAFLPPTGVTTGEEHIRGAGARVNAPPAPLSMVLDDEKEEEVVDAPERAPASLSPASQETGLDRGASAPASVLTEPAPRDTGRRPVTLDDLDALAAEEAAAAARPEVMAAAALAEALGDRPDAWAFFVDEMVAGFIGGDAEAATFVAEQVATILFHLYDADGQPLRGAHRTVLAKRRWSSLFAVAHELLHAINPARAAAALTDFERAVAVAGEAEKAAHRAALAEAEDEAAPPKTAAEKD
jgi:hypothetical protein